MKKMNLLFMGFLVLAVVFVSLFAGWFSQTAENVQPRDVVAQADAIINQGR